METLLSKNMANTSGFINYGYTTESPSASIPGEYKNISSIPAEVFTIEDLVKREISQDVKLPIIKINNETKESQRDKWGKDIEFLLSCIALSVGLGNVWRFPFVAMDNGGGAFIIPYIIVLLLVGKPIYYMEMIIGQFSSSGSIKVFDFSPAMRGVGYGQVLSTAIVTTYYASIMAITIHYFFASFNAILPWSYCREEWNEFCIDSSLKSQPESYNHTHKGRTSAELYFIKEVLREKNTIDDGIGYPNGELVLCLGLSWSLVALILIKGVQSSGKASYFLAIFPYVVMGILLIRSVTLPGAFDGVIYFIRPQWNKLLDPKVWYAAVTQVFFSLAICFGNIIMYASYNRFSHNIYRDSIIITTLDTFTSLLSGVIIFGILGNLAYETNESDISKVVKGGSGLAFISYPDAIAKFQYVPQIFSLLFFLMLFVLGIGSNVGMASCVMTVIRERFTNLKNWLIACLISIIGFSIGLIYLTPGGQFILNLLDFYGASFVAFVLAIAELIAIGWIYGVNRLCEDVEFMLGIHTGAYWRICWAIITPILMGTILIYSLVEWEPLKYKGYIYPDFAYVFGWCLSAFGILQLLFWFLYAVRKQSAVSIFMKIYFSFKPQNDWGPLDPILREKYKRFLVDHNNKRLFKRNNFWYKIYDNIFG